jgi:hexosaminidase
MHPVFADLSIIPLPSAIRHSTGTFALTPKTVIVSDADNRWNATYLRDLIAPSTGLALPVQVGEPIGNAVIRLHTGGNRDTLGREGYALSVSPTTVTVEAPTTTGVFYGIQTLRQLFPPQVECKSPVANTAWEVPCIEIEDAPRFAWRGYMMDEGRHFHGKETMLRTLELMALQKLNVLHWHLTEDQGWRIEIKQYPRLTEVGSTRKGTTRALFGKHDGVPCGGFYTQQEVAEIVAYAAQRHITIVPEIEMPGHALAALAAYPELSCTGGPFEVACRFGIMSDTYCPGKETVFTFLQNVLDEVMALFPSPFIHIGGDEVPKRRWKTCPDCQGRIQQEGLRDERGLQVYLTNRIAAYLASRGRRMVGWNEILQDGLADSAVAQYWIRHRKDVVEAIRHGRDVIVSPFWHAYLDHSYSLTPLSRAYAFEPVFADLDADDAQHVLGLEALMWTEFVPNRARLDYQTHPRLAAFAETGWSPRERKDWRSFRGRLDRWMQRLDALGVQYARGADLEPPWFKRALGVLTIAQPQTKTISRFDNLPALSYDTSS